MKNIIITGGAGFIGSHVVRLFVNKYPDYHIINLDKLTYAGNLANLKDIEDKPNYTFVKGDICDFDLMLKLMQEYKAKIKNIRQYDMVLAHDYTSKMGMQLMLRCIFAGVPYCINCDGAFVYPHWLKDRIKSFFIKRATAFFASGQSAKEYLTHYGATEDKIYYHKFTATHRKDMPAECPTKEERSAYRKELGFAEK